MLERKYNKKMHKGRQIFYLHLPFEADLEFEVFLFVMFLIFFRVCVLGICLKC